MSRLGKAWLAYTIGFCFFIIVLALLERAGMITPRQIGFTFLFATIGLYAGIGIYTRTRKIPEYYVAGRVIPGIFNGMATASDWMSAASFISMAGSLYLLGYDGLAYIMGWTGGYVLLALFLSPYIRKFGQYTIPDFVTARYGGNDARVVAVVCAIIVSFTYVIAQVTGVGIITSRFLGIPYGIGVFVGLSGILVCSFLGGMRAVTWTQVAQYIILIIAYMIPSIAISMKFTGVPIPQLMYGEALQNIVRLEQALNLPSYIQPFRTWAPSQTIILTLVLMAGTAGLPHILIRFYTVPSVRQARYSTGWALFFIFLLYFTAPAYAAFARWNILANVVGQKIAELPGWVAAWGKVGLLKIVDANGDGILQFAELQINPDLIVLSTPEIAGLAYVIAGLVAAGGLAAALSTADGLLLVCSTALSHDLYYKIVNPRASTSLRMIISRMMILLVAAGAAYVASFRLALIVEIVAWAFSLAAASFFPVLVMGIFWKRTSKAAAMSGMIVGISTTIAYIIAARFYGVEIWGLKSTSAGIFGMTINFLLCWLVSLFTPPPPQHVQDMVTELRYPKRLAVETEVKE